MSDFLILDEETQKNNSFNNKNLNQKDLLNKINDFLYSFQKIKTKEKVIFYRLMATMVNAGLGLVKSIGVLEKQEKNPLFKKILSKFREEVSSGKSLSDCMELYPNSFLEAEIGIIKSGEKTGKLNNALVELANQIEKVESLTGKIRGAMMYPFFIVLVVIGVVTVMMTVVVPKLLEIFQGADNLPTSTKILVATSHFFTSYWYILIFAVVFIYVGIKIWRKTPNGAYIYDKLILKVPIFGEINKKLILSKFSRIFSGLLSSGVSVIESLNIVSKALGNEAYKQRVLLLNEDVRKGIKIAESLEGDTLFPEMMIQMIQVGEETAKLDQTVLKVADFYDEQVDNTIGVLNKLLEPFIIVVLATIVGFIAIGIMQPIMNLADTISSS